MSAEMLDRPPLEEAGAGGKPSAAGTSWLSLLWREPLVHFLLCAAVLIYVRSLFGHPEITVSPEAIQGLRQDFASRAGRPATPAEVERLVQEYIDDEVLNRAALERGFERDPRVRTLLAQTMRGTLRPVLPEPTDAELEALRQESPEAYRYPRKLSFDHVSFAEEKDVSPGLLERLRRGDSPQGLGNVPKVPNPFPPSEPSQIGWYFGPDFSEALAACPEAAWTGPIRSKRGLHFVRVLAHEAPRDRPLAEIRPKLVAQWIARREAGEVSAKVAELRRAYRIVRPAPVAEPAPAPATAPAVSAPAARTPAAL